MDYFIDPNSNTEKKIKYIPLNGKDRNSENFKKKERENNSNRTLNIIGN